MSALCRPARYVMGETVHSLPLLFWLIGACRPSSYASLGLGDGTSYFAACQAIEKQDHTARCYGFAANEDSAAIQRIESYNEDNYGGFSQLFLTGLQIPAEVHAGGIDLLHINLNGLNLEPDALQTWVRDWTKHLSDQAVVLIQGGKEAGSLSAMLEATLKQAKPDRPSIEFARDNGSILLLYGEQQSEVLLKLAELRFGDAGYAEIQYVFSRLGQLHYKEWAHREVRHELQWTQDALSQAESREAMSTSAQAKLAEQLEKINQAYDDRSNRTASLQAMLFDMQNELTRKVAQLSELERSLGNAGAQVESLQLAAAERDVRLAAAEKACEAAKPELETLKLAVAQRDRDLAAAERTCEEARTELEALKLIGTERDRDLAAAEGALEDARAEMEALKLANAQRDSDLAAAERASEEARTELEALKLIGTERERCLAVAEQASGLARAELEALMLADTEREREIAVVKQALKEARAELQTLKLAASDRDRDLVAVEQRSESARAMLEALEHRMRKITAEAEELKSHLAEERDTREAAQLETQAARQQIDTRFQELAKLTRKLEEHNQLLAASRTSESQARAQCERLKNEVGAREHEVIELQARLNRVMGHYQKIRNTRSWRVTAPVRHLGKLIKKRVK